MLRNIAAVVAGMVAGMAFNLAIVQLNLVFFPLPPGLDPSDPEAFRQLIAQMPPSAWILVFVAHLGMAYVAGRVAGRLSASDPMGPAVAVGVLSLLAGIANASMLGAPRWTWIEMPFYLVLAWLAGRQEAARRAT